MSTVFPQISCILAGCARELHIANRHFVQSAPALFVHLTNFKTFFKKGFTNRKLSVIILWYRKKHAAIAQVVECILGKDEVTSSNLVSSSITKDRSNRGGFSFIRKKSVTSSRA